MKNSNRIIFINIISTLILQGLAFFSTPVFSRILGTENYGIVSIYITWVSVVSIIFGLRTNSTLAVSMNEYSKEEQPQYQSSVFFLSLIGFLVLSLLTLFFITPISKVIKLEKTIIFIILLQGFGNYCVTFANSKFTYEFKAGWNLVLSILSSGGSIVLSLILISFFDKQNNYWGRILGQAIVYFIIGIIICIYILKKGKTFYKWTYWKFCIPIAIPVIFHNLSGLVLNQSDRVMLQHLETNAIVGIYSLAYSFSAVLATIWNAFNNSWVPFYYDYTRENKITEMKLHAKNYIELYTTLSIGFMLLSPEVYRVFAGSEYLQGTSLIYIFTIGNYFVFLYSFPVNYEFYNKKTSIIATGTIAAGVCNVILNVFFIIRFGMIGAAWATTIAHFLQFLFHHVCAKYRVRGKNCYPFRLFPMLILGLVVVAIAWVGEWFNDAVLLRWGLGIALGLYELVRIWKRKSIF